MTKTENPLIDSIVETQTNFINNWVDSAKKFQSAFSNGNMNGQGQSIYNDWLEKQMQILNGMKESSNNLFNSTSNSNPQDFFKNWFNQQADFSKQMADFNQSIFNSYSNFGKPAQDYMSNFGNANNAFTNIYNSWVQTLNSTYDVMSKNMNGAFNKDVFSNFVQGNQLYTKMQAFFQPMIDAAKNGQFNFESFKSYFTPENYQNLSKQLFSNLYQGPDLKEVYDNGINQLQKFFTSNHNLSKEYFEQISKMKNEFPQLFSGNFEKVKELYGQVNNVFGKTFEPLLKVVSPGKEKENIEATITLMDKLAEYTIKQSELQALLHSTTQASIEKVAKDFAEKFKTPESLTKMPNTQELYNEWISVNEKLFTDLFASDEFSKVKGAALNLSMDVKKQFQTQFEQVFENFPVVFKSETEELHKSIYDLKKQVKELQNKLAIATNDSDEEKSSKTRKK
ncbi:MAG: hypothetical protein IPM51_02845 [Sphingobacteriaceae bacterium]|nr:hypothetical protein [Sphingobacteriaceae bacterium]